MFYINFINILNFYCRALINFPVKSTFGWGKSMFYMSSAEFIHW